MGISGERPEGRGHADAEARGFEYGVSDRRRKGPMTGGPSGGAVKPGLLVLTDRPDLFENLLTPEVREACRPGFCEKNGNLFSAIEGRGIRIALLDAAGDGERDMKLLRVIRTIDPIIEVVVVGPPLPSAGVMDWINQGATDYLLAPLSPDVLPLILERQEEKRLLRRETFALELELEKKYAFQDMVGKSPFMLDVFGLIENVAKHFSTVLVTGETGTGKELAARALWAVSPLRKAKFVTCDCAAIPDNLLESELFGYVKGAFTGAEQDKKGLFEEADRGVIFLDEVGEIPLPLQGKLLRVIETSRFRPVGATTERQVEVRIIAASNRNMEEMVRKGAFRADLFHRLNKVEVRLPPLRERAEDIVLLARHFLARFNKKFEKSIKGISREVQKFFNLYPWPGNVRELENAVESACLVSQKDFIDFSGLPKYLQNKNAALARNLPSFTDQSFSLQNLEKEYIEHQLIAHNGNIKQTAEVLKISRTSLYARLRKYGIDSSRKKA
jgi:DNA-binding NtrC family response regulator